MITHMNMKKITSLIAIGALLFTASGCSEYDFDSKYEDPSKVTQVTISNLNGRSIPESEGL